MSLGFLQYILIDFSVIPRNTQQLSQTHLFDLVSTFHGPTFATVGCHWPN